MSIHSQLTSSLMDSTDDEAKKKADAIAAKKAKKGLSQAELDEIIDVNLKETKTLTLMVIRGTVVNQETEEHAQATADNKAYEQLKQNKIGSDSYMQRGSQTLNLTQKSKALNFQGFTQETKDVTASKADIDDASKEEKITNAKRQELAYLKSIDDIMAEKLKNPNSLFDAEALASHISIVTSQSATKDVGKSGSNSSKGGRNSRMRSSQSGIKDSKNESEPSSSVSGSMSKT
jgi:hypothetical protein